MSRNRWIGILAVLVLLISGAFISFNRANYLRDTVRDELSSQQISFSPAENLSEHELQLPGMEKYAGQELTTGDQARVYASYIKLHLEESSVEAGLPGATYATIGGEQRPLRAELTAAIEANDSARAEQIQTRLDELSALRDSHFRGNMLRGTLLNAYGWDLVASYMFIVGWAMTAAAVITGISAVMIFAVTRRRVEITKEVSEISPEATPVYAD